MARSWAQHRAKPLIRSFSYIPIVRNPIYIRFLVITSACLFLLAATVIALPAVQGGRGGSNPPNPLSSQPPPRLPDGTVNLGRVPGELGIWQLPYITNMGARNIVAGAPPSAARGEGAAPAGQRGGAPAEPWVPFQPWAAAV